MPQNKSPGLGARAVAKTAAKRALDLAFGARVAALRGLGVIDFPVPPNHSLRITSSTTVRHYYETGLTTLLPIVTAAMTHGADFETPLKVLDFGCGVGRQLLHLDRMFPNVEAHGCDVNHDSVRYVQQTFPRVKASVNAFDPPLPYEDHRFDLINSVSTFSHFSQADAVGWLQELRRVVRPSGLLCLTYNAGTALGRSHARGARTDYTLDRLKTDGVWFDADEPAFAATKAEEEVSAFACSLIGITLLYGEMHYAPEVFARLAADQGFTVLSNLPGIIDRYQDMLVLRAPS
jgi:SAM-dependent methyltransferase